MLQIGFFIFFNLLGFFFLFYSIKRNRSIFTDVLLMFSMVLFFGLGFYVLPEEDIGTQINYIDDQGMNITETHTFIEDRETFYLIYIYWGMALISFILFMLGHVSFGGSKF